MPSASDLSSRPSSALGAEPRGNPRLEPSRVLYGAGAEPCSALQAWEPNPCTTYTCQLWLCLIAHDLFLSHIVEEDGAFGGQNNMDLDKKTMDEDDDLLGEEEKEFNDSKKSCLGTNESASKDGNVNSQDDSKNKQSQGKQAMGAEVLGALDGVRPMELGAASSFPADFPSEETLRQLAENIVDGVVHH